MMGEKAVVMAVSDTDSAVLPLDKAERKLEILPPGHDAIKIIPSATIGVITGFNTKATANVKAGRASHCNINPTMIDLGFSTMSLSVLNLISSATPNITNARMIFTIITPPSPKFMATVLRDSSCSFMIS